jgi:hypothetical protein
MVAIRYEELSFDHIVEFTRDSTIFAAAREGLSGHLRLFLIHQHTGNVYTRNGRADSWEELIGRERDSVIARLISARNSGLAVYRLTGASKDSVN